MAAPERTAEDVARWMLEEVSTTGYLYQQDAVAEIEERFGSTFVYENERGNPAIHRGVLAAFRKLSEDSVVWDRWDKSWRPRTPDDQPGRKQE
jgi:hypothetical protein